MTDPKYTVDGYLSRPLTEGSTRKGGTNPAMSQIPIRPPAPSPIRPGSSQGGGNPGGGQGPQASNGTNRGQS